MNLENKSDEEDHVNTRPSLVDSIIRFCLERKVIVALVVVFVLVWGVLVAPFDWEVKGMPRSPVPTDAIPDIGENQQIVFTEWMGRSPQDIEDQISYPLTVSLMGIPGIKTIRSYSMFGFSTVYVIFKDDIEFYWSRSRVLEKLNSLPSGTLPQGVQPSLGPDATALGQVYWYTLEGQDENGKPTGGWDLNELRSTQDWQVRYALLSADGVSEVASVGGFVQEYQIDVDPDAMRAHGVSLEEVFMAVKMSNLDVGARTIEVNRVEYVIRGIGFVKHLEDIETAVIKVNDNVPIYVKNVANVSLGPSLRRGALDKGGAEAVGGVVVVRYGGNPLSTIKNVKAKIKEIEPGLPAKILIDYDKVSFESIEKYAQEKGFAAFRNDQLNQEAWLNWWNESAPEDRPSWAVKSKIAVVPFYDRTGLIYETLGTLNSALTEEILVTSIIVLVMVAHLTSSFLISALLPFAVLMCFIAMKYFGVDANIVALSGIAIAIGTMVDMGIIVCENILKHLEEANPGEDRLEVIYRATSEVGSAVLTAVSTTIVSFLPVFAMEAAEGKLFKPLAFTKTFALIASVITALTIIPPAAHILFSRRIKSKTLKQVFYSFLLSAGIVLLFLFPWWIGFTVLLLSVYKLMEQWLPGSIVRNIARISSLGAAVLIGILLTDHWLPFGPEKGFGLNAVFVFSVFGSLLTFFHFRLKYYPQLLLNCINHKVAFLSLPLCILIVGAMVWLGFNTVFGWLPGFVRESEPAQYIARSFPGLGKEFMPPLDEGSYLFMPTTMPHASIGEVLEVLKTQDASIGEIPEVESVVGKLGRADTPLDPAPISMIETVINYKSEYIVDKDGQRLRYRFDSDSTDYFRNEAGMVVTAPDGLSYRVQGKYERSELGELIPDVHGRPFRQWRPALELNLNPGREHWKGIAEPDDIWRQILDAAVVPGTTSAPRLQPIAARIVMLQSGMRAPMGVKVKGPTLEAIEKVGLQIEKFLKEVPAVEPAAVTADRIVGKPYLEIHIDRKAIARHGIMLNKVQDVIEVAIGGKRITTTVEGRERYPVRVRYMRELRDTIESLEKILVPAANGSQIPLDQLTSIEYLRGPQVIKSEDTKLVGYVLFDMKPGNAEVDVVHAADRYLKQKIESGELNIGPGVSYVFSGSYENQIRSEKRLRIVLPLSLFIIFLILYLEFKKTWATALVFTGIGVAWAGGFILLWLYGQPWFLNVSIAGVNLQEMFQIHPINLSVAVWVGFLALFGIATDDGVVMGTFLKDSFEKRKTESIDEIRLAVLEGGKRRIRPCLMTTATTILALIPVLTSTGRGADILVPMAIPSFGGMTIEMMTTLIVPVLFSAVQEFKLRTKLSDGAVSTISLLTGFMVPVLYCSLADYFEKHKQAKA